MKSFFTLVLCLSFASFAAAADKKKKKQVPIADPVRTKALFKEMDTNSDGMLSFNEFTPKGVNTTRAGNIFGMLDKDTSASLSLEEYLAKLPAKK